MSYEVGEKVEVHAFGHWYEGEVVKLGKLKLGVRYLHVRYTSGTGATRVKVVHPERDEFLPGEGWGPKVRKLEQEPLTLSSLPAPEVEEDHQRACSFAGCRVRFPD